MKSFEFRLIDAFTSQRFHGNPCAVVIGSELPSPDDMLKIAKEMNQSETAFVVKENDHLRARYFTPEREIPLAGHPTIATVYAALELGLISLTRQKTSITLELKDGPIKVEVEKNHEKTLIRMFQRKPQFLDVHDPQKVLPLFGLEPSDLLSGSQIQTVSTGTPQLMIPLSSLDSLRKMQLDVDAYKKYRNEKKFFSPHLFCLKGATSNGQTFARHPGAPPDTFEDSFTGSATGGMAAYLWKYGFIKNPKFTAEQGHWMGRPGLAYVEVIGTPNAIETVSVAGEAVTVVSGTITL